METSIAERAQYFLSTDFYQAVNSPEKVDEIQLTPGEERQYVLRCPIKLFGSSVLVPEELTWTQPLIDAAQQYQEEVVGVDQPHMYLTVRHGEVTSQTDDEFHVDGFSLKSEHIPEQNYVWSNCFQIRNV